MNNRIDLTQFEEKKYEEEYDEMQDMAPTEYLDSVLDMRRKLIAELKRMYGREDRLLEEKSYLHEKLRTTRTMLDRLVTKATKEIISIRDETIYASE